MIATLFRMTPRDRWRFYPAIIIGVITGIISAFVKSGTEEILPPRTPDRIAPPLKMLRDMGIDWHHLVYSYSGQVVYWGGNFVHIAFSVLAAIFYCIVAEVFPRITMYQGIVFGLLFAIVCHGVMLPVLGLSPSVSHIPVDEVISEILGTCLWIWVIELLRQVLRGKFVRI
ncbi:TPA: DUF1440 domain-containing protein [Salmonella enterica subsp. salamae serovar 9,46:z4,z24:z39:z42]|nr:DUF1440 domain-containing protein [Salmonella enterica subsp. salamae serovar 9,46:z4,z24:z39:z42]